MMMMMMMMMMINSFIPGTKHKLSLPKIIPVTERWTVDILWIT